MGQARIPQEVIETVLKSHDIVEVVGRYVALAKRGRNFVGLCPFHSEKTPSFNVNPEKGFFHCFGCGKGGDLFRFVMEMESVTFPEAVAMLAESAGIPVDWRDDEREETPEQRERKQLLDAHELAAQWFHHILLNTSAGEAAMRYLTNRGFTHKWLSAFQIGYAPPMRDKLVQFLSSHSYPPDAMEKGGLIRSGEAGYADLFRDRVMFPIHNGAGQVVAFAGRALQDDVQPKYLNSPETVLFSKSAIVFNLHRAKADIRKKRRAVLFEGYMDVIKAWHAGVLNGVATMGTALTERHVQLLRRYADEIVVCFDGDEAGRAATLKTLELLDKERIRASVALIPDKLDPDDYISRFGGERFLSEIIEKPLTATAFRLLHLRSRHRLQHDEGKLQYIQDALKIIAALPSPVEREYYLRDLSVEFAYSLETLKQECLRLRQEIGKKRRIRDNNAISWNNVMNRYETTEKIPVLLPAYQKAERNLLAIMMHDPQVASYVEKKIGADFNVELHCALAAHIYAFYARHSVPDARKLLGTLDEELESLASELMMLYTEPMANPQAIEDYIREIKKYPLQRLIAQKKKALQEAERGGDKDEAARIGEEIITLVQELRSYQRP